MTHPSPLSQPSTEAGADLVSEYTAAYAAWRIHGDGSFAACEAAEHALRAALASVEAPTEPSDARVHDVAVAFEQFKAWPTVTAINNMRIKLDEAEAYIKLLKGVASL